MQRSIRFPPDIHEAIEAEAKRRGHPHSFSSIVVNAVRSAISQPAESPRPANKPPATVQRGSVSPSLERFK